MKRWGKIAVGLLALGLVALSVFMLERGPAGLVITDLTVGTTPATRTSSRGRLGRWWWWRMVLPARVS